MSEKKQCYCDPGPQAQLPSKTVTGNLMDLHLMLLFLEVELCSLGQHLSQVIHILSSRATLPSWMLDLSKRYYQVEISVLLRLRQAISI